MRGFSARVNLSKRSGLPLACADGWSEVAPRATGYALAWTAKGALRLAGTDFQRARTLDQVGPADCPVAHDPASGAVFRYACQGRLIASDFSEIRRYPVASGDVGGGAGGIAVRGRGGEIAERGGGAPRLHVRLRTNQWIVWLFELLPGDRPELVGLLVTDMPGDRVRLRHQLLFVDVASGTTRVVALCTDAFVPLSVDAGRRTILFSGNAGIYLVDFAGRRLRTFDRPQPGSSLGRGGAIHPGGELLALGGGGLYLWHREDGREPGDRGQSRPPQVLDRAGHFPVWDHAGERIFYAHSSGNILAYGLRDGSRQTLVSLADEPYPEKAHARPLRLSPCGRYLAACLTRQDRRTTAGPDTAAARSEENAAFVHRHALVVLDLAERQVWQHPGFADQMAWVALAGGDAEA